MTTIALHPNIVLTLKEWEKQLLNASELAGEPALTMRVNFRNGVPRHWKVTLEEEPNLPDIDRANRPRVD